MTRADVTDENIPGERETRSAKTLGTLRVRGLCGSCCLTLASRTEVHQPHGASRRHATHPQRQQEQQEQQEQQQPPNA